MKSTEHTYSSLLATEGGQWHFHVPRFQRQYVWRKNNWSKLLEDIQDDEIGHYMGSIICVFDESALTPGSELIYEVVDGQQRLITISILLCAIYEKLTYMANESPSLKENEDFIIKRNGIKKRLIKQLGHNNLYSRKTEWGLFSSGDIRYCLRVQPSTQEKNLDDYKYILKDVAILPEAQDPPYVGNRRLYKSLEYFRDHIPSDMEGLYDLLERIYNLTFIHITEATQAKAFMLFETLNYRGVPLSAVDIIKNKMLATLEQKGEDIDDSYDKWQVLLNYLPEDKDQDRYLRQFYNAFKINPKIKVPNISRATNSNVITIYEWLIKKDAKFLLTELLQKAEIYNKLIASGSKNGQSDLSHPLLDLQRVGAAPAYTFLLYLFSLPDSSFTEADVKKRVIELLCKYYFRRNVTDIPSTRDLDSINVSLIEKCDENIREGNKIDFNFIASQLLSGKGQPASLDQFRTVLLDNLFYNNEYMARYALVELDESYQDKEYKPDLWEKNEKGEFIWTVEHIFPQGERIPSEWVNMIADGDKERAEIIQARWVHCLGNLTLTGYNSNLSNKPFNQKQEKSQINVFGTRIFIGYKNGLALNNIPFCVGNKELTLATADKWTEEYIKARNEAMVDRLIRLFKFYNE